MEIILGLLKHVCECIITHTSYKNILCITSFLLADVYAYFYFCYCKQCYNACVYMHSSHELLNLHLAHFPYACIAVAGPGWSLQPRTHSGSLMWVADTWVISCCLSGCALPRSGVWSLNPSTPRGDTVDLKDVLTAMQMSMSGLYCIEWIISSNIFWIRDCENILW